ncbi:MAG: chemotaxis-specific protein-glutamate methyltransferase CheB [Phycisphaerales bacterium JB064]
MPWCAGIAANCRDLRSQEWPSVRVLIVDDSSFMRSAIRRILSASPDITVVGEARNGQEGVDQARALKPDVVTLDVEMPVLDGLGALREIVKLPTAPAVLMCSSLTAEGSDAALQALASGAADVIAKAASAGQMSSLGPELIEKVMAIGQAVQRRHHRLANREAPRQIHPADPIRTHRTRTVQEFHPDLVVIGSSTGGPPVLETVLKGLKPGFRMPVVVAQHMPRPFTERMSTRLRDVTGLDVQHVEDRMVAQGGVVYIAPGGTHTHLKGGVGKPIVMRTSDEPTSHLYRPSVDVLFLTAEEVAGAGVLGIMLTGMGRDGSNGAKAIVDAGGCVLTQSEQSCVVYGMPKAVDDQGISSASLEPDGLAAALGTIGRRSAA